MSDNVMNDTPVDPESVKAAKPQINNDLVAALKAILADAEKGNIHGMGFIRINQVGGFNVFIAGAHFPLQINAGACMLVAGCVSDWRTELERQIQAHVQHGLQRATLADLQNLPLQPGRRR